MRQTPTPWQYLIDLVSSARIKAAYKSGDQKLIDQAEKYYRSLSEDECVFTTPVKVPEALGKYQCDMSVKGRGFKIEKLRFNTGTVSAMVRPQANYMVEKKSLDTVTVTGLYFVVETDQLHLVIHPRSNIWEALKMTGYEFAPATFSTVSYDNRDTNLKADGHVDIKLPVVAGRIYISYVQRDVVTPPVAATEVVEQKEALNTVVEDKPFVDFKMLGDSAVAAVKDQEANIPTEESVEVPDTEVEPEVTQPVTNTQKKKNR